MVRTCGGRRLRQGHRLRHGRHLDRRVALRGRVRARVRDAGRRRAHARADDDHPHRRRRRRLDPALRRARYRVGPDSAGANPGPGLLPARRPAHRDRLQRDAGQDPARVLPAGVRARAATSRSTPERGARVRSCSPPRSRGHRRRAARRRRWPRGSCTSPWRTWPTRSRHLGAARPRRHRVHAALLRRRRRPARLPRGRRAGHDAGAHPSARRRAVGLRHGPRRHADAARAGGRAPRSSEAHGRARGDDCAAGRAARARARGARAASSSACASACTCATRAPTPRSPCPWAIADAMRAEFEPPITARASASSCPTAR